RRDCYRAPASIGWTLQRDARRATTASVQSSGTQDSTQSRWALVSRPRDRRPRTRGRPPRSTTRDGGAPLRERGEDRRAPPLRRPTREITTPPHGAAPAPTACVVRQSFPRA